MMSSPDPGTLLEPALPAIDTLDSRSAADTLGTIKHIRGHLDAYEARLTSHIRTLHQHGESAPAADLHTRCSGASTKDAHTKERRAEILDAAPSLSERLAAGATTAAHADVLADLSNRLDDGTRTALFDLEADLAHDATRMTPEEFRRTCRDLIRRLEHDHGITRDRQQRNATRLTKTIDRDGMYVLNARMHPELGNIVFNTIDAETSALITAGGDRSADRAALAAHALGNLLTGGHQATRPAEAEIRLHVDAHTLIDEPHPNSICEYDDGQPVPPNTVQRLVCNGRIVPIVIDTNGVVLDAGRQQRLANRHQRRALRAMYPTCAIPGCDITFQRCEIHHTIPFEHGGNTDLDHLLPICSRHHHLIHQPGWELELLPDRTLHITQPDGTRTRTPLPTAPRPRQRPRPEPTDESHRRRTPAA
jgi:hypothetical protein